MQQLVDEVRGLLVLRTRRGEHVECVVGKHAVLHVFLSVNAIELVHHHVEGTQTILAEGGKVVTHVGKIVGKLHGVPFFLVGVLATHSTTHGLRMCPTAFQKNVTGARRGEDNSIIVQVLRDTRHSSVLVWERGSRSGTDE